MTDFKDLLIPASDLGFCSKTIIRKNMSEQALFIRNHVDGEYSWRPYHVPEGVDIPKSDFSSSMLKNVIYDAQNTLRAYWPEEAFEGFSKLQIISRTFAITNLNPTYSHMHEYVGDVVGLQSCWRQARFMTTNFTTKKQILKHLITYISNNLYKLYEETYFLPDNKTSQWWLSFLKADVNLKELFDNG